MTDTCSESRLRYYWICFQSLLLILFRSLAAKIAVQFNFQKFFRCLFAGIECPVTVRTAKAPILSTVKVRYPFRRWSWPV